MKETTERRPAVDSSAKRNCEARKKQDRETGRARKRVTRAGRGKVRWNTAGKRKESVSGEAQDRPNSGKP